MRVLLVNKFLYPKGGAETYTLALGEMLKKNGHQVQFFGLRNQKNTVGNNVNALVEDMDFSKGVIANLKAPFRIIYNSNARKQIRKVLDDFKPDVVHLNNIEYHLTPSIILEISKWKKDTNNKCKVIYTAHDYQLVCPSHGMFDTQLKPCELCLDGKYYHCFNTKCLKDSRAKSFLGMLDSYFWASSKVYDGVDHIICCSNFLKKKLDTQDRFKNKTIAINNFKDIKPVENIEKKGYVLQFGHLSKDKGTETILEVAKRMPNTKFIFIGYGSSVDKMKEIKNVEYLGFKTGEELNRLIAEASVSICASEMYENCPFSVIESISYGTPVVGTTMGGIPELIDEGNTGELYEAGNVDELYEKINKIISDKLTLHRYEENCLKYKFETSETYYKKMMELYK